MSESTEHAREREQRAGQGVQGEPPSDGELERLRALLVGAERARLAALEGRRLEAREVAALLPRAVHQSAKSGDELGRSLSPLMETALQDSVRRNPKALADAIFPILGPAIRKSIAVSLAAMLEGLNRTLEHSVSPRSWAWRFEAWRTHKSFAEIVLLRTLTFRVEQVFLIHAESGLVLQHLVAPSVRVADPDLVAGMLTAIGDFTARSFAGGDDAGEPPQHIEFGQSVIEVRRGPHAVLAAVVRGFAPAEWRAELQRRLELIQRHHASELSHFRGDVEVFEAARGLLEPLLVERATPRRSSWIAWLALALVMVVAMGWATRSTLLWLEARELRAEVERVLRAEPGWLLLELAPAGRGLRATALRDRGARDAAAVLRSMSIDPARLELRVHTAALEPDGGAK